LRTGLSPGQKAIYICPHGTLAPFGETAKMGEVQILMEEYRTLFENTTPSVDNAARHKEMKKIVALNEKPEGDSSPETLNTGLLGK